MSDPNGGADEGRKEPATGDGRILRGARRRAGRGRGDHRHRAAAGDRRRQRRPGRRRRARVDHHDHHDVDLDRLVGLGRAPPRSTTKAATLPPAQVTVRVLNGSGVAGAAGHAHQHAQGQGLQDARRERRAPRAPAPSSTRRRAGPRSARRSRVWCRTPRCRRCRPRCPVARTPTASSSSGADIAADSALDDAVAHAARRTRAYRARHGLRRHARRHRAASRRRAAARRGRAAARTRSSTGSAVVGIVSGRPVEFLRTHLPVPGLALVGQYGLERWVGGRRSRTIPGSSRSWPRSPTSPPGPTPSCPGCWSSARAGSR